MKAIHIYAAVALFSLLACTKENEQISPGNFTIVPFAAMPKTATIKAGESLSFQFEGNADTIYFYSGEFGKDYNFRNGRIVNIEQPSLSIRTRSSYGEQKSLSILLSQDFNGDYSYNGVTAATWKDMTSKFNIPTPTGTNALSFTSTPTDISEFIDLDKPYYIAVRNDLKPTTSGNRPTQWDFYGTNGFAFTGIANGTSIDILPTFGAANWKVVATGYAGGELDGTRGPRMSPNNSAAPTSIFLARNTDSNIAMDAWAVTKVFSPTQNISGDKGTLIKRITDLPLQEYTHIYTTPGEYEVVFDTINQDRTSKLIKFKITVTND